MKNKLALAVTVLALFMSSCTTDDGPSTQNSPKVIQFSSRLVTSTKASISTLDDIKSQGFSLTAVRHAGDWNTLAVTDKTPNFMYNQSIEWNTGLVAFTYSPLKYWPLNADKISFFAFAPRPSGEESTYSLSAIEAGRPYIQFITPAQSTQQVDLLTAKSLNCVFENTGADDGSVYFDFIHPLSKIAFAAKLKEALPTGVTITLNTLRFYYASEDTHGLYSQGRYYLDEEAWVLGDTTFPDTADGAGEALVSTDIAITSHTTATPLTGADDYLMFIPQVYNQGAMYVTLDYTINYADPESTYTNQRVVTDVKMTLPVILDNEETNIGWAAGESYTYVLEISDTYIETSEPT